MLCAKHHVEGKAQCLHGPEQRSCVIHDITDLSVAASLARWVSTQWLKQWADSESCDAIDNGPIVCTHGKLAPDKVTGQTPLQITCS